MPSQTIANPEPDEHALVEHGFVPDGDLEVERIDRPPVHVLSRPNTDYTPAIANAGVHDMVFHETLLVERNHDSAALADRLSALRLAFTTEIASETWP